MPYFPKALGSLNKIFFSNLAVSQDQIIILNIVVSSIRYQDHQTLGL